MPSVDIRERHSEITSGGTTFFITVTFNIAGVSLSAIDVLCLDYPKYLDLIFIYLSDLMISTWKSSIPEACLD